MGTVRKTQDGRDLVSRHYITGRYKIRNIEEEGYCTCGSEMCQGDTIIEIHVREGDEIIDLADSVCSLSCARELMEKWENSYES